MTSHELYKLVQQRLADKIPFFAVRMGDGEAIVLNGDNDKESLRWLFKRQLGHLPPQDHIDQIRDNLIEAYKTADIIGMPENKREGLNEFWYQCHNLLEKEIGVFPDTTSVDFHNEWLDSGLLHELLKGQKLLFYASCHDLSFKLSRLTGGDVYGIHITGEQTFFPTREKNHYPDQFNEIKKWIGETDMTGCLFIYGAGVVGKIYGKFAAERGAVALDIGNVMDLWGGYKTRGEGRGAGVKYEKYKL